MQFFLALHAHLEVVLRNEETARTTKNAGSASEMATGAGIGSDARSSKHRHCVHMCARLFQPQQPKRNRRAGWCTWPLRFRRGEELWAVCVCMCVCACGHLLLDSFSHKPNDAKRVVGEAIEKRLRRVEARRLFALHLGLADVDLPASAPIQPQLRAPATSLLQHRASIAVWVCVLACEESESARARERERETSHTHVIHECNLERLSSRHSGDLCLAGLHPLALDEHRARAALTLFALVRNEGVGLPGKVTPT